MRRNRRRSALRDARPGAVNHDANHARLRTKLKPVQTKQKRAAKVQSPLRLEPASSLLCKTDSALPPRVIAKDQRRHRLDNRHGTRQHTWIMAAASRKLRLLLRASHRPLFPRDRRWRFKCHSKVNFFTVTDPALHAAGIIRRRTDSTAADFKRIVMLRAAHSRRCKAGTDFKSFCCGQAHHSLGQIGLQLVKDWLAQSGRNPATDTFRHAPN